MLTQKKGLWILLLMLTVVALSVPMVLARGLGGLGGGARGSIRHAGGARGYGRTIPGGGMGYGRTTAAMSDVGRGASMPQGHLLGPGGAVGAGRYDMGIRAYDRYHNSHDVRDGWSAGAPVRPLDDGTGSVGKLGLKTHHVEGSKYYQRGEKYFRPVYISGQVGLREVPKPVVSSLDRNYKPVVIDDKTYYHHEGHYYRTADENGETVYLLTDPPGRPQAATTSTSNQLVDPAALLSEASASLVKLRNFTIVARQTVDQVMGTGQKIQMSARRTIRVSRPDKVYAQMSGDGDDRQAWYDGSTLTILDRKSNKYGTIEVPDTIDATLDFIARRYGFTLPLADLLYSDEQALLKDKRVPLYAGVAKVGRHRCHQITFSGFDLDWQIWIDQADPPLPRKLAVTYKQKWGSPRYVAIIESWDTEEEFPAGQFDFQAPAGAEKIQMLPFAQQN